MPEKKVAFFRPSKEVKTLMNSALAADLSHLKMTAEMALAETLGITAGSMSRACFLSEYAPAQPVACWMISMTGCATGPLP